MLLAHYAVAFAAKRYAPRTSLGTLILAAQLLDLLWPLFLLAGWERVRIVPGSLRASSLEFEHYPISHSLLMAVVFAGLFGAAYKLFRRYPPGAVAVTVAVISHWCLDALMHRPDLPLWPGSSRKIGLGLWNSLGATIFIEVVVLGFCVLVYARVTRPSDTTGTRALAALVGVLLLVFALSLFGPAAPGEDAVAWLTLCLWGLVPWGYWIDRHREASRLHGSLN